MTTPPVFPTLNPGWSSTKRVKAGSTLLATAGTGRTIRGQLWVYPMWEWDLTWEYLPDFQGNGVTASDFRTLLGAFLAQAGGFAGFLYQDQDENAVTGQVIATADGVSQSYGLFKSYGLPSGAIEPIGYLDAAATFNVYLGGVLQGGSAYSVDSSVPYSQIITFAGVPSAGTLISVDMSFYYWVHFKDDIQEFDEFMEQLWSQAKITLESLKG